MCLGKANFIELGDAWEEGREVLPLPFMNGNDGEVCARCWGAPAAEQLVKFAVNRNKRRGDRHKVNLESLGKLGGESARLVICEAKAGTVHLKCGGELGV